MNFFLLNFQIAMICEGTYYRHQRDYLLPLVLGEWQTQKEDLLADARRRGNLTLEGDGRCDSPGHSALYGAYSLIDFAINKVIALETVKVIDMVFK